MKNKDFDNDVLYFVPNIPPSYLNKEENKDDINRTNYEYIAKIVEKLEEKDIKYNFFIPPYNSLSLSIIHDNSYQKEYINNLKKYVVEISKYPVYDMAFPNKYTNNDFLTDEDTLYLDYMHPNFLLGIKLFKVLVDTKSAEKDTYIILTKDNFAEQILYEDKLMDEYIKSHTNSISKYKQYIDSAKRGKKSEYARELKLENVPKKFQKEIDYITNFEKNYERI